MCSSCLLCSVAARVIVLFRRARSIVNRSVLGRGGLRQWGLGANGSTERGVGPPTCCPGETSDQATVAEL